MKMMVVIGLLAPLLAFLTAKDGAIVQRYIEGEFSKKSLDSIDLIFFVLSSIPLFLASFSILSKKSLSRILFFVGWLFICLYPLAITLIRQSLPQLFLVELSFNAAIGIAMSAYLYLNKDAKAYFEPWRLLFNLVKCLVDVGHFYMRANFWKTHVGIRRNGIKRMVPKFTSIWVF